MVDSLGDRSGSRCYSKDRTSELIYVDKSHHSHLWDRMSVPAQYACVVHYACAVANLV